MVFSWRRLLNLFTQTQAQRFLSARETSRKYQFGFEALEDRTVPIAISWMLNASGSWHLASNWSPAQVPGPEDEVTINVAADITVTHSTGVTSVRSITNQETLSVTGGSSLTVLEQLTSGPGSTLSASAARFRAAGLPGSTTVHGANLLATEGGRVALPAATNYSHASTANGQTRTLRATGPDSVLDLGNVTTVTNGANNGSRIHILAEASGTVDLRGTTRILEAAGGTSTNRRVDVEAAAPGSALLLDALIEFRDVNNQFLSSLSARDGGAIQAPALTTLAGVHVRLDDTGVLPIAQFVTALSGRFDLSGSPKTTYAFPALTNASGTAFHVTQVRAELTAVTNLSFGLVSLTGGGTADLPVASNITGAEFTVADGVTLALPAATSYSQAGAASGLTRTLRATGPGSVLDLGNVMTVTNGANNNSRTHILAEAGGTVDLRGATRILEAAGGDSRNRRVNVEAAGPGSAVLLDTLLEFRDVNSDLLSSLSARDGGAIQAPALTTLAGVHVRLDETGVLPFAQFVTATGGRFDLSGSPKTTYAFPVLKNVSGTAFHITQVRAELTAVTNLSFGSVSLAGGGTADLPVASDIRGAEFTVADGVTLALPAAKSYSHASTANGQTRTLRATGPGSVLDLGNVTTVTNGGNYGSRTHILAEAGGTVDLRGVTRILEGVGDLSSRRVDVEAAGLGSAVLLDALTEFHDGSDQSHSSLHARDDGAIYVGVAAARTLLTNVRLWLYTAGYLWTETLELGPGCLLSGVGTIFGNFRVNGGSPRIESSSDVLTITGDYEHVSGIFSGSGTLSVGGLLTWTGGALYGDVGSPNARTIASRLAIAGNADKFLDGRILINADAGTWTGSGDVVLSNNARFEIGGLDIQNDASLRYGYGSGPVVMNRGGITKAVTLGRATHIGVYFVNQGTVTVSAGELSAVGVVTTGLVVVSGAASRFTAVSYTQAEAGSLTILDGGTLNANVTLSGGSLHGYGTITGNLNNYARVVVGGAESIGALTVGGNYVQSFAGVLELEIAESDAYDRLDVRGSATLSATLTVSRLNDFIPEIDSTFLLLTAQGGLSGTFGTINGLPIDVDREFQATYLATAFSLTVVAI